MTDQTDKEAKLDSDERNKTNEGLDELAQKSDDETTNSEAPSEETPEDAPSKEVKAESPPKASSAGKFFIVILIFMVLLLASAGYGGWRVWQQNQSQLSDLKAQNQVLSDQIASAQIQINEVSQRRESYADDLSSQITQIEALVVQSAQRMNRQADQTENRWPLEEALTLTRLAQRRLFLDKDASVSISLLKSADDILATLDAAAVLPLREQIAKDILALNKAKSIDLNGTYFQLAAIADEVRELTWLPQPALKQTIEPEANLVEGFWQSMKQVVVVTRLDDIVQAPPLQSDFELWRQHTLMVLAQAQLALLAQNQALYETALTQTLEQLAQMSSQFDLSTTTEQLTELKDYRLNPVWPDIGNSVLKLKDYINQQNQTETNASEEAQS